VDDEKEVDIKAQENLDNYLKWMAWVDKSATEAGITLEQAVLFFERMGANEKEFGYSEGGIKNGI
jgi:hypothetical protein